MTALRGLFHALRSSGGRKLYLQALAFNVLNNLILGPPTYAYVATYHLSEPFPPLRCGSPPAALRPSGTTRDTPEAARG